VILRQLPLDRRRRDVVVVGSGGAGLVAAIVASDGGSDVVVLEKSSMIGGTTAISGGMPWIPVNDHMAELGIDDSRDEALTYVRRLTCGHEPDPALLEVYVDEAPRMLEYLETRTPLRMAVPPTFNDYYADLPGGKEAGRSVEPLPVDARQALGDDAGLLRTSPHLPWLTMDEGAKFLRGDGPPDVALALQRQASDERVLGAALVTSLCRALAERQVDLVIETPVERLVVDGRDDVVGVQARLQGRTELVEARQGVVLACGGFEWNESMVRGFLGQPVFPLSVPSNEGDGHRMGMEVGARLDNMSSFWGQPAVLEPGFEYEGRPMAQMASVRGARGVIVVNRHAQRFVNEGVTYQDFPKVLSHFDPVRLEYPNEGPLWAVFDQRTKDSIVVLPSVLPGQPAPAWIPRAESVPELAELIGVDSVQLSSTVERWNQHVASGRDPDFDRGTMRFESHMTGRAPNAARLLAPVSRPPFYAVPLCNGTLGTNGGVLVDRHARVRGWGRDVIPGLYAAGNVAASVFGPAYPGGGATLGPALTLGYLAGRHVAIRDRTQEGQPRHQPDPASSARR
jgi:3-oxosteroid 1-dehydrogenase